MDTQLAGNFWEVCVELVWERIDIKEPSCSHINLNTLVTVHSDTSSTLEPSFQGKDWRQRVHFVIWSNSPPENHLTRRGSCQEWFAVHLTILSLAWTPSFLRCPLTISAAPYLSCRKIGNVGGWKVYNRGEEMSILTPLSVLTDAATTFDQPLCFVWQMRPVQRREESLALCSGVDSGPFACRSFLFVWFANVFGDEADG